MAEAAAREPGLKTVVGASAAGTAFEWYDFFIFAQATALVFAALFFQPMGENGSQIAAWATLGISFLIRPLGAIIAGHSATASAASSSCPSR